MRPAARRRSAMTAASLEGAVFVTGNAAKLEEARRIAGAGLQAVSLDLPEIQSLDLRVVLAAKAEEAWRRLARPLVVEESGLELAALNSFPGPLVKWMLAAVGPRGIALTALSLGDDRATARCALLYRDAEFSLVAEGASAGRLILPPRGSTGFGWDPVFLPEGDTRTYAELAGPEKDALSHRGRAWCSLLRRLEQSSRVV